MTAYSDAVVKAALAVAAYLRMDLVVLGSNLPKIVLNAVQGGPICATWYKGVA